MGIARLAAALSAVLLLAGCSGAETGIVPSEAAARVLEEVAFRDTLVEAEGDVAKEWYDFDENVTEYCVYISGSGATAEEVAVIKTSDIDSAKATVQKRVDDLRYRFQDYVPAEMQKLESPVIASKSDAVILIIADDSAAAEEVAASILNS
jgi:kynureninase